MASKSDKSVGIEHATSNAIQEALANVYELMETRVVNDITKADLIRYGLVGNQKAKVRREKLGEYLYIGYTNGKQLLRRLHMFQIKKNELNEAMKHILEGENECD